MTQSMNTYCMIDQEEIDPDLRKDRYVSFRLLLSEVEDLKSMAKAENKNVSRFIRSKIFTNKIAA